MRNIRDAEQRQAELAEKRQRIRLNAELRALGCDHSADTAAGQAFLAGYLTALRDLRKDTQ